MFFNRRDIIQAYMRFYKHFHGMNFSGTRYHRKSSIYTDFQGRKNEEYIDRIDLRIVEIFKMYYLPVNEITSQPMTDNAKEIFKYLFVKFDILKPHHFKKTTEITKEDIEYYSAIFLKDADKGFVCFGKTLI